MYLHAEAGFFIKSTCLRAIKAGNFATWSSLTYSNVAKYLPQSIETLKVNVVQLCQGLQYTKAKIDTQQPRTKEADYLPPP